MATTTTTTTSTGPALGMIAIDRGYVTTLMGKLTILALIINIICFICVAAQWVYLHAQGWFYFVCSAGFWFSLFELLLSLCGVQGRIAVVPWKLGYLIYHGLWTLFYFIAAIAVTVQASGFANTGNWYACSFFGFVACIIYGFSTFIRFNEWKVSRIASTTSQPA